MKKILSLFGACAVFASISFADINMYGPGGPHFALKEVAKAYEDKTGVKVNVNFGPQATWFEKAKKDADILFGASDQSALAIATDFDSFDPKKIQPLYFREAVILTQKGNPLKIKGLKDLASKNVKVVVPEGAGKSNTSGTGVWEDMIGRTKNIDTIKKFRNNIVAFTPNSGGARKLFLDQKADAWITWSDWVKANPDFGDVVSIEKDLVVYRTINVVAKNDSDKQTQDFIKFLQTDDAYKIFKKYGYNK
ncbi:substrate-binding domain-containing protein [Campylobacter volucris]|uniref:extracellular solute-binding protein n=1 Tax=Campylobacter volucris TaxID=1031542 RepID=UPI00189DB302|nr:extracellular solute-binding protein [Campylobacter volucris]MBF7049326.1 substrate-binding domain-containing protein [Campylobacter volucris]MBF7060064.1 substrate-binding domain-containing protein [Campylobacter volucris]